jgi:hypothetical protein
MTRMSRQLLATVVALALSVSATLAQSRGGAAGARGTSRSSVNRSANVNRNQNVNVNRNVNVNQNVNVNRDVDVNVHGGYYRGGYSSGCCYNPVAAAVAVTAATAVTAAAIGSMVNTLPPACSAVMAGGVTYQQCGSTWYQPQFVGTSSTYVVVAAPR